MPPCLPIKLYRLRALVWGSLVLSFLKILLEEFPGGPAVKDSALSLLWLGLLLWHGFDPRPRTSARPVRGKRKRKKKKPISMKRIKYLKGIKYLILKPQVKGLVQTES